MAQAPAFAASTADPEYLTFEEFLALAEPERAEWVDGRLVEMPGVTLAHDEITGFLYRLLMSFCEKQRLGRVLQDPFLMRLGEQRRGRAPDLMFIANEHLDRLRENYLDGPADIAVEVMSPGHRAVDRGEKYYEYEAAGIAEYWLIDPERRVAEFYRLDGDGHYALVPVPDGVFRSEVLAGFWVRVSWLWERPALAEAEADLGIR